MAASIERICDPGFYRLSEAIQKAKLAAQSAPGFEIDFVRYLQVQCMAVHVDLQIVFRGLEVLTAIPDESRLIPLLRPFLRSNDPQIASKCVLVLGRQTNSLVWINSIMEESDDRVRANLIEALWTRREPDVEPVLRNALADPNPRVAANAVYGLFLLGCDAYLEGLEQLIQNENAAFRKMAVWILKTAGIPDAAVRIKVLIRDTDADVRRAVFDALISIRENGSRRTNGAPLAESLPDAAPIPSV